MSKELFFLNKASQLGGLVDASSLIEQSTHEDMCVLSPDVIAQHRLGIYLTEGLGKVPAVGYIALKEIYPISRSTYIGVVGALCVLPEKRGQGYGSLLATEITERVLTANPDIDYCEASCNTQSIGPLYQAGFRAREIQGDGKVLVSKHVGLG